MDFSSCFRDGTMQVSSILQLIMIKLELASDVKVSILDVFVLRFWLLSGASCQGGCFQALELDDYIINKSQVYWIVDFITHI